MATEVRNSLTQKTTAVDKPKTFSQFLGGDGVKASLVNSLGSEKAMTKFTSSILSAVSVNPALQKCEYSTVVSAGLLANALELSLSPSLGYAYIVPFEDRKAGKTNAVFVCGYRGLLQLAIRSGYYKRINVLEIKEGELVHYDAFNEEIEVSLIENDEERESKPTIGYYAMFEHINGFKKVLYWSKKKMVSHAKQYSRGYSSDLSKGTQYTFWAKDFDSMAKKTMLRQLLSKWGIMSIDMQTAYDEDTASMRKQEDAYAEMEVADETDFFAGAEEVTPAETDGAST